MKILFPLSSVLALLLVVITTTNVQTTECLLVTSDRFNASSSSDFLPEAHDEFIMESETNRRILAFGKGKTIAPRVLNQNKLICNRNVYGSCPGASIRIPGKNCGYKNHCRQV